MIWLIIAVTGATGIVWEDCKYRLVHVWWYIVLLIGLVGVTFTVRRTEELLLSTGMNLLFVFLLIILLTGYFSVRHRRWINLFDRYIGWGDILFFLVVAVYFTLEHYILFTIVTLILALCISPMIFWLQGKERHVPLAGIQAACLAIYLPLCYFGWYTLPAVLQA